MSDTVAMTMRRWLSGFTLVELLIVIGIIGLIMSVSVIAFSGASLKARDARIKTRAYANDRALAQYRAEVGKYPVTTPSTIDIGSGGNALETYLVPHYLATNSTYSSPLAAKYTVNTDGSWFAQAWQLYNETEQIVTSGNGVYITNYHNTAGNVAFDSTRSGAANFNGTDQSIVIPHNNALNFPGGDFTISFWYKPTGANSPGDVFINKCSNTDYSAACGYKVTIFGAGIVRFKYTTATGNVELYNPLVNISSGGTDGWHHIVIGRQGSSGEMFIAVDNIPGATYTNFPINKFPGTVPLSTNYNVELGGGMTSSLQWQGIAASFDDLRFYNTYLTTGSGSELEALYNAGRGSYLTGNENGLIAGYRFDEGTGTTLVNYGPSSAINPPSSVDGTLQNYGANSWTSGNIPLGLSGIGSSLTGRAFVTYGPQ